MLKGSKGSFLSFRQIIPQYDGIPELPQQRSSLVPKLIWSLWDTGIENAPTMQSTCLWSQRAANPTFEARQLDLQSAINMTNVLSLIPEDMRLGMYSVYQHLAYFGWVDSKLKSISQGGGVS